MLHIDVGCEGSPPIASFCEIFCLEYTDMEILEGTVDLDSVSGFETEGDLTMEPGGVLDVDAGTAAGFRLICS